MLLNWLSRLCASVLVSLLTAAIFVLVLAQTVFNPVYLRHELQATHAYDRIASAITKQIVDSNQGSPVPSSLLASQLQQVITPQLVQQQLDGTIDETKAYYNGSGTLPSLDLSKQAAQLQAAGLQLPQGTDITTPIQIKPLAKVKDVKRTVDGIIVAAIIFIVLLLAVILAIAAKRRNYKPVAGIFISIGIIVGISSLTMLLISPITRQWVTAAQSTALTDLLRDLAQSITHDIGLRLGYIALAFLAVGIIGRIVVGRLMRKPVLASIPPAPALRPMVSALPHDDVVPSAEPALDTETPKQTN